MAPSPPDFTPPLPPVPPELKSITPFLQRAKELKDTNPIIAYWCAYYAAQQGIALKVKESSARHFLISLLGLLERMKKDVGEDDAVRDEAASAAYIENFALNVFFAADKEYMSGSASKKTARNFHAAANFLELLRIFDSEKTATDLPSIEEKIKYAKWKAVELAKAPPAPQPPAAAPDVPDLNIVPPPTTPPSASSNLPVKSSPPAFARPTPPPPPLTELSPTEVEGQNGLPLPDGLAPPQPPQSPGSWSIAAAPGTPGFHLDDGSPSQSPLSAGPTRRAFVSGELEGKTEEEIDAETTPPASASKSVHFSPSVTGGLETPSAPGVGPTEEDPFTVRVVQNFPPPEPSAPPFDPSYASPPPPAAPSTSSSHPHAHAHSVPLATSPLPDETTATVTTMPAALTPDIIGRAQKHCRFAISALDYEDSQQAIKELRAALRMLGG